VASRIVVCAAVELTRRSLADHLTREGREVAVAEDGLQALGRVVQDRPGALVLDLQTTQFDGLGVLAKVRENAPEVAIVALVAPGAFDVARAALRLGAAGYVFLPADPRDVSLQLERALPTPRPAAARPAAPPSGCPFDLPEDGVNLDAVERGLLVQALDRVKGNQSRAARLLGISRFALRYRMEKYGMLEGRANPNTQARLAAERAQRSA
jgi:DNA-binding NtrC family response regulator